MKLYSIVLFLLYPIFMIGQNCIPNAFTINLRKEELSIPNIQNNIKSSSKTFPIDTLVNERYRIEECNKKIRLDLSNIDEKIKDLSNLKNELSTYQDVEGLKRLISIYNKNKEEVKANLKKDISRIERKGLFAVLLKDLDDILPPINQLNQNAETLLLPYAVEQLNGSYIKRILIAENYNKVQDVIETFTSGSMGIVKNYSNNPNIQKKHYLYIAEVSVSPKFGGSLQSSSINIPKGHVYNLEQYETELPKLQAEGVDDEDIDIIRSLLKFKLNEIEIENNNSENKYKEYILSAENSVRNIETKIEQENLKISSRGQKISDICNILNIKFIPNDINQSANSAMTKIEDKTIELFRDREKVKEKEIFYIESLLINPSNAAEDLARSIYELSERIENEKERTDGIQIKREVNNNTLQSYTVTSTIVYRQIDLVWGVVIADKRQYKVGLFAKFKITSERTLTSKEYNEKQLRDAEEREKREFIEKEKRRREEEYKRIAEEKRREEELKRKRREGRIEKIENFITNLNALNLNYHYNRNYNLVDFGVRWGEFESDYENGYLWGPSIGWYWLKDTAKGLSLTGNGAYYFQKDSSWGLGLFEDYDIWYYLSCNLRLGIGKDAFFSFEPRFGLRLFTAFYCTIGYEFRTKSTPALGLQVGVNFPINE